MFSPPGNGPDCFPLSERRSERSASWQGRENLDSHRIISNYEIAEGLEADFLLKNGAMHVIETVDASDDHTSARKIVSDIAVSALVLEQARMTFGENAARSNLVYDASSTLERIATPSLDAAAHQGAVLVNWASGDDRRRYIVAGRPSDTLPIKEIQRHEPHHGNHAGPPVSTLSAFSV